MLALRGGDGAAFDVLFQRWAGRLLRYLERVVGDAATAEELVQEAFLRVYRARERYEPGARFSTWLYTIGTRLALNELRRPVRRSPHQSTDDPDGPPLTLAADGAPPDRVADARRLAGRIEAHLAELPERQRAALLLAAVEGLSYAEVAAALQTTEKSVKALVHRARAALADRMAAPEPASGPGPAPAAAGRAGSGGEEDA